MTVYLTKVICGAELNILQDGIPDIIPVVMCNLGWQDSLAQLINLVEPRLLGKFMM